MNNLYKDVGIGVIKYILIAAGIGILFLIIKIQLNKLINKYLKGRNKRK
jgi:hypothetical protein